MSSPQPPVSLQLQGGGVRPRASCRAHELGAGVSPGGRTAPQLVELSRPLHRFLHLASQSGGHHGRVGTLGWGSGRVRPARGSARSGCLSDLCYSSPCEASDTLGPGFQRVSEPLRVRAPGLLRPLLQPRGERALWAGGSCVGAGTGTLPSGSLAVFLQRLYSFILEREEGREKERERNVQQLPLTRAPTGTELAAWACALTRNRAGDLWVCGRTPSPQSRTPQGGHLQKGTSQWRESHVPGWEGDVLKVSELPGATSGFTELQSRQHLVPVALHKGVKNRGGKGLAEPAGRGWGWPERQGPRFCSSPSREGRAEPFLCSVSAVVLTPRPGT